MQIGSMLAGISSLALIILKISDHHHSRYGLKLSKLELKRYNFIAFVREVMMRKEKYQHASSLDYEVIKYRLDLLGISFCNHEKWMIKDSQSSQYENDFEGYKLSKKLILKTTYLSLIRSEQTLSAIWLFFGG